MSKLESVKRPFPRMHYNEAVKILNEHRAAKRAAGEKLEGGAEIPDFPWGDDFGGEDETVISSRFDPNSGTALNLRTELYIKPPGGEPQRITFYNRTPTDKFIVKDFDWDRTGTKILYLVWGPTQASAQLWMLSFR